MHNHFVTEVVTHSRNGNEAPVEPKIVEVEGKKFLADDTDPSKPKLDDKQQPIPYVEKKVDAPKIEDISKATLEELAKANPALAALLDEHGKLKTTLTDKEKEALEKANKELEEKGEWQKLATTRGTELETTKGTLKQKEDMLGKYVETTQKVLDGLLKTIPKENLSLIPADFSPRQKLEYIIANADRLGAKVNAAGGKIDKSDETPAGTDEDKMVTRIEELTKKATARTATNTELQELRELGSKLTALRREKAEKK